MSDTFKEGMIEVLKGQARAAPEVLTVAGSVLMGAILVFGNISFQDPMFSEVIARNVFRLIGVTFIVAPVYLLYRGDFDE